MQQNILITGGTGLVGTRLSEKLIEKGYTVSILSRNAGEGKIKKYRWDLKADHIDDAAIATADYIIHLAGAGVFDKRWTSSFKKEILDSRVNSTNLLGKKIASIPNSIKAVISASAIGIYGFDTGDNWQTETSPSGDGFLAEITKKWEAATESIAKAGKRLAIIRIGIVLSDKGGALQELSRPVKYFAGASLGSGNQYVSWIHMDDLCDMFIYAIENEKLSGVYNAVAPEPVTNKTLTKEIDKVLNRPLWLPNVPSFVMKLIVGAEQALIVLGGNRVSAKKIMEKGFKFKFASLTNALSDLLKNNK
jgi:uncharacterized protein (TIGR01777 family)